jgi:hypothetical protein
MLSLLRLALAAPGDELLVASLKVSLTPGWAAPEPIQAEEFWTRAGAAARPVEIVQVRGSGTGREFVGWVTVREGQPSLAFTDDPADKEAANALLAQKLTRTPQGWKGPGVELSTLWAPDPAPLSLIAWSRWGRVELLTRFEGDLYAPVPVAKPRSTEAAMRALVAAKERQDPAAIRKSVRAVLAAPLPSDDRRWAGVIAAAREVGDLDSALAAHRYFCPVGWCSMDSTPEDAARDYASTCHAAGRTGCALSLYVQAMDYWGLERNAWSTYGESASETGVDALVDLGLDVPDFLLGLAHTFDGVDDLGVSLQRLGRAVRETARREEATAAFRAAAEDPTLDEYNRLIAGIVLYSATHGDPKLSEPSTATRAWLAGKAR